MSGELNRPLTLLELWDRTNTKKGSIEFVSKPAAEIPSSYYSMRIRSRLSSDGTYAGSFGTGASSSSTGAHLPDELFTRAMDKLIEKFATNDRFRQCWLPNHERIHFLVREVAATTTPDSQVISSELFDLFRQEIINMLIIVLEDVFCPVITQTEGGTSSNTHTQEHPPESRHEDDHRTPNDAPIDRDATRGRKKWQ